MSETSRRQLIELLQNPRKFVGQCEHAAQLLFALIYDAWGEDHARWIFARLGQRPDQRKITDSRLLSQLHFMNGRLTIKQLARDTAAENRRLKPSERPKGRAGSTNPETVRRHITELRKKQREKEEKERRRQTQLADETLKLAKRHLSTLAQRLGQFAPRIVPAWDKNRSKLSQRGTKSD